ncbi:zinc ribbon domain-containing protein [Rhodopirellula sp. MGV]|uniref:zinc ribbon domain-containing protein n=1 Tax=Rhodopirellula sp. MGV TaxID=2023130 RepID=UPI000B97AD66|nr:phospholipase [Rhodopirellula sp. MGV]OYP31154.1 phospholipase [Rhodopirellula sp. MGV]PNY36022.1 phospholipase [Rhodopirellula baltica]
MAVDKNITFDGDLLRRLHSLHLQVSDLESQLARGPRQIKASEAIVQQCEEDLDNARADVRSATMICDEKQLQLKSREDHIEQLKAKLNTAASNKEFNLLKEQIAADEQANSVQSDEILEGLERIDSLNEVVVEAEKVLKSKIAEQEQHTKQVQTRLEKVKSDLEYIREELAKAEKQVPASVKSEYVRLTSSRGDEALAAIEDDSCGGCNQMLTTHMIDRIRLGFLIECPACAAWLYRK